jgi:beta-phosphoglucomutase family hydrolase
VRSDVAVLFDLDGVLVDSRAHHLTAWQRFARERGIEPEPGYFHRTFGLRNDAILGGLVGGASEADLERMAEEKERIFREIARGRIALLPGARELLAFLREQEVAKAVVTSTPRANLEMILESLGLAGWFEALVTAEDVTRGKPDPEGFLLAARKLGIEPRRCVVIEDAPAGLEAAKAAGMRAIGVTTTHPAADLGAADLVVESLAEEAVRVFV